MSETLYLTQLCAQLEIEEWWKELLGQPADFATFDPYITMETLPRTEIKAAEEVHRKFRNFLSFTERNKRWYIWDGRIHTPCDGEGIAIKVAKKYFEAMNTTLQFVQQAMRMRAMEIESSGGTTGAADAAKYMAIYEKGEYTKHRAFRDRMSSDAGLSALIRMMRTECDVPSDYYDNDQDWLVVRNGVLDLKAVKESAKWADESKVVFNWYPHDASRPVTKFFDADKDYLTNYGHWDTFLERSIPDSDGRNYLQIVTGAAMMGMSKLRCIMSLVGPPHSGKSVFINTLFTLGKEGAGYACMPDSRALTKVTGQNFEQDNFRGRRIISVPEPSSTEKIDDDFLKRFTGDIWVETRTLNEKSTGFVPQGVAFVASNDQLKINTREQAIVERVQVIEFPIHFELPMPGIFIPEERRAVEGLEEKILEDRNRILTWILIGMRKFVAGGMKLHPPASVLAKRGEVVVKASQALRFIEDYIEDELFQINFDAEPKYLVGIDDAYTRYLDWCVRNGERKPLPKKFFREDIEKWYNSGGEKIRHEGKNRFFGVQVTQKYQQLYAVGDYHAAEE